jgi:hypothetical protein
MTSSSSSSLTVSFFILVIVFSFRVRASEEQYYTWATSVDGGFLSRDEAETKWKAWKADKKIDTDQEGPERAPLRIAIPNFEKVIDSVTGAYTEKTAMFKGKDQKNVTADDTARLKNAIMTGHDNIGGLQTDMKHVGSLIAKGVASSSSDVGVFSGVGMSQLDLMQDVVEGMNQEAEPTPSKRSADDMSGSPENTDDAASVATSTCTGPTPKKSSKTAYYDVKRARTLAVQDWRSKCITQKDEGAELVKKIGAILGEHANFIDEDNTSNKAQIVGPSLRLARDRFNALTRVFAENEYGTEEQRNDDENLQNFLKAVKEEREVVDTSSKKEGAALKIVPSAPIQQFLNLMTLVSLRGWVNAKLDDCSDKKSFDQVKSEWKPYRDALQDLLASSKRSLADVEKALSNKGTKKGSAAGSDSGKKAVPFDKHSMVPEIGKEVASCTDPGTPHFASSMDMSCPVVIRAARFAKDHR